MLWTIFVILLVLWLLGIVSSYTLGGFIHILLVIALVVLILQFDFRPQTGCLTQPRRLSRRAGHSACSELVDQDRIGIERGNVNAPPAK